MTIVADQCATDPRRQPFVAPLEQTPRPAGRMQRDDRGHRGEAHLEAWPGERFGAEDQHDQRAGGDQPQADRVAPQRNAGEDQQRRDAAPHCRHLRAGQQV